MSKEDYIESIKNTYRQQNLGPPRRLDEIVQVLETSIDELETNITTENEFESYFGSPLEFITDYLSTRELQKPRAKEESIINRIQYWWVQYREYVNRPANSEKKAWVRYFLLGLAAICGLFLLGEFPKLVLEYPQYSSPIEYIDDFELLVTLMVLYPFILELGNGVSAQSILKHSDMLLVRSVFRVIYPLWFLLFEITYHLGLSSLDPGILFFAWYEVTILFRHYFIHGNVKEISYPWYRYYLIFLLVLFVFAYVTNHIL